VRIGIDATPIFIHLGGIGYYILNILKELARIDRENEYLLYNTGHFSVRSQLPFAHAGNFRSATVLRFALRWHTKRDRIDIFHGANYRLRGRGRCGSVVSIYDLSVARYPHLFRKGTGRRRDFRKSRKVANVADRVITISKHSALDIMELYGVPKERIAVIHCGMGEEFYPETDQALICRVRKEYRIENRKYILYVGGSDPRKNVLTLLKAYGSLPECHQETALVLVGSMRKRSEQIYKFIRDNRLERDVMIVGDIPQDALRVLYSQASVFAFPSLYEGFGMPILEAMACGTPVIASDTSSIPEVAGDAALLIDPHDEGALRASIRSILKDGNMRERMKVRGYSRVKLFSWEAGARYTLNIYQDLYRSYGDPAC